MVVLIRVVILHIVIVETADALGVSRKLLEWLLDAEKITSDGMMINQTRIFDC